MKMVLHGLSAWEEHIGDDTGMEWMNGKSVIALAVDFFSRIESAMMNRKALN